MTIKVYIRPMIKTRRIIFLIYEGFELLDFSGPASVFNTASRWAGEAIYSVVVVSETGGNISTDGGVEINTIPVSDIHFRATDTVLCVGANEDALYSVMANHVLQNFVVKAARKVERYGSVCTGTFILAEAGLLENRKVATHWRACDLLSKSFEHVQVQADALYVVDGRLWTSAGVTTGIDMSLAMVEQDHDAALMGAVAKSLVVYAHRPGHQSQFSMVLDAQTASKGMFADMISWLEDRLGMSIKVEDMARFVNMSTRTFSRKFTNSIGVPPAKFLEIRRLERAKEYLEAGMSVKQTIALVGFKSASAFRTTYRVRFGVTPSFHSNLSK